MCLEWLFGRKDTSASEQLMREQLEQTRRANDLATEQARIAQEKTAAAMVSPADSEPARKASETKLRRLMQIPGALPALGPPPVSYKLLMGT